MWLRKRIRVYERSYFALNKLERRAITWLCVYTRSFSLLQVSSDVSIYLYIITKENEKKRG